MYQETEAQKVIAISLGKIATSRSQRGGPKLFKNLLVANVIQKARVVVLDETAYQYRTRYEHPSVDERTEQWNVICDVRSEPENSSLNVGGNVSDLSNECNRPSESRDDSVQSDVVSSSSYVMDISDNCACWDEQNKENVVPITENTADRTNTQVCNRNVFAGEKLYYSSTVTLPSRCVKRRNSTSEDLSSLQTTKKARKENSKLSPRQHWRRSSDSNSQLESESDIDDHLGLGLSSSSEIYRSDDQMDLEQITNLVSVFSSSFKGLVDNPSQNSTTGSDLNGFYIGEKPTQRRGASSLPDVGAAVCSKQAGSVFTVRQSSFETPSLPPIVALTV